MGLDGSDREAFDHGTQGREAAGMAPVAPAPVAPIDISNPSFDSQNTTTWGLAEPARRVLAVAAFRGRMLQALREVDDALAELQGRAAVVEAQNQTLASASQALTVAKSRYDKGAVSYLDVTEAERTPLATERALAQLRGAQWAATAQLVKALGGGWATPGG